MRASQRVSLRLKIAFHRAAPSPGDPSLETFGATDDCDTIHKCSPARPRPGRGCCAIQLSLAPQSDANNMMVGGDRSPVMTGPCRRLHRRHRARRFRPVPASTRNTRPLATLSAYPGGGLLSEPAGGGCLHAHQKPRDPPVRVADRWGKRGASTAPPDDGDPSGRATLLPDPRMHHRPGSPHRRREAELEADDHGRADRAWAIHPAAALDESGADLVMSDITRQDRWRLRSEVHIRVSPLCS